MGRRLMGRRLRGRIRLLRDLGLEVEVGVEVGGWFEEIGNGKRLAAEMERRLVGSVEWMRGLFVAGSWIPSLRSESRGYWRYWEA